MKLHHASLLAACLLALPANALAGTCMIEVTGQKDRYKFVHVFDFTARTTALRKAIKSGDSREVSVAGDHVRVDWKFPGDKDYRLGRVAVCQKGSRIKV